MRIVATMPQFFWLDNSLCLLIDRRLTPYQYKAIEDKLL